MILMKNGPPRLEGYLFPWAFFMHAIIPWIPHKPKMPFFVPPGPPQTPRGREKNTRKTAPRGGPPLKPPLFLQKTGPRTYGIMAGLVIVKYTIRGSEESREFP